MPLKYAQEKRDMMHCRMKIKSKPKPLLKVLFLQNMNWMMPTGRIPTPAVDSGSG